jgi:hypothetical protein
LGRDGNDDADPHRVDEQRHRDDGQHAPPGI